ncbi:MAG: hypothetical protein IPN79_09910 [Saprospiraceae bacterium]|nr:hypothetical protein [Saprospiraceae bacterium]
MQTVYEIANGQPINSGPCLEIIRKYNNLRLIPFVGAQLINEFSREIHQNLQNQLRNYLISNLLTLNEKQNFVCSSINPCNNPNTRSFKTLRVDCWSKCVDGSFPDPDDPSITLFLLRSAKCGYSGCCVETRPFCIDSNGNICYGTATNQVINECKQDNLNFLDPCTVNIANCPEVCSQ